MVQFAELRRVEHCKTDGKGIGRVERLFVGPDAEIVLNMDELDVLTVPFLAVRHYGPEHQKRKAVEEMGELITALSREQDGRATPEQVITEIADVHLMIRQLMIIYGLDVCLKEYDRKQRRLLRRIAKETGGDYRKEFEDGNIE